MIEGELERAKAAFAADDATTIADLLASTPALRVKINDPIGPFDSPVINHVRSRAMLDVLLDAGADINARSKWWAGGFGLLDSAEPELAHYAISRGATLTPHAAARLGMLDELKRLIGENPARVHERGGDGQTPLHFASTIEVAEYLLGKGADIDAKDVDHESTPAQWMVKSRMDVARFLVEKGASCDLLMAAALGNSARAAAILENDPGAIRLRVSHEHFPMINPRSGGTIYQWVLGWYVSAHHVAREFGHESLLVLLMDRSPDEVKLVAACWLGDEALVDSLRGRALKFLAEDRSMIAHAARNNDLDAVRLMLRAELPMDGLAQHKATALHWAAFHGNAAIVDELLARGAQLEVRDADHNGTPLNWAIYGSLHGWHASSGDYAGTVEALVEAGARLPSTAGGSEAVQAVLARVGVKS